MARQSATCGCGYRRRAIQHRRGRARLWFDCAVRALCPATDDEDRQTSLPLLDRLPPIALGCPRHRSRVALTISDLPALNATLNGTSAIFLTVGYIFIRQGRVTLHKRCMLSALVASTLF